ncbi:MAG TPA: low molecular weight phosphotyrosine protein phosphatase [Gammaproteobacteria bacterium]|nr:low molecular weight phosphotyrosine protein phosphatase [Gammaproteobacteria bacterium]
MVNVLFVCMGNICRSPTAEGVFRHVVEKAGLSHAIEIDSAGTHAYHIGEPPDPRSTSTAAQRGIDLSRQRARRVTPEDFDHFDFVLAMDLDNYANLSNICAPHHADKLQLFLEYARNLPETEVPDPYYGGARGFDHVLDLIEAASEGLLTEIKQRHL